MQILQKTYVAQRDEIILSVTTDGINLLLVSDGLVGCMHYVYLLKLENTKKNFYIGCTSDLKRRMAEHSCGNTQTTRNKNPRLIYYEAFPSKELAYKREKGLKSSGSVYNALLKRLELK